MTNGKISVPTVNNDNLPDYTLASASDFFLFHRIFQYSLTTIKLTSMRKLLFILCMVATHTVVYTQSAQEKALSASMKSDAQINLLFEARTKLSSSNKSTREVDRKLGQLGIKFPAKVKMTNLNGKTTIAFVLIEDYQTSSMVRKIERIKNSSPEIEYLGIDSFNDQCYVTFSEGVHERKIEKLLTEFLYDGYYISLPSKIQLGAVTK